MAAEPRASNSFELAFSAHGISQDEFFLFEMPPVMLEILKNQQRLELRGGTSDPAVLVTADRTYDVRLVETSNSLLLVDPNSLQPMQLPVHVHRPSSDDPPAERAPLSVPSAGRGEAEGNTVDSAKRQRVMAIPIVGSATRTYELVEKPPSLQQLVQLLTPTLTAPVPDDEDGGGEGVSGENGAEAAELEAESALHARDEEHKEIEGSRRPSDGSAEGFSWRQLTARIQASDGQLRTALRRIDAVRTPAGRWRLLPEQHLSLTFDAVISAVANAGWPLGAVPLGELMVVCIGQVPGWLVREVVRLLEAAIDGEIQRADGGGETVVLCPQKVARFRGRQILRKHSPQILSDFLEAWRGSLSAVPELANLPSLELLQGVALAEPAEHSTVKDSRSHRHLANAVPKGLLQVRLFERIGLPDQPSQRFRQLFAVRKRWPQPDIAAYVEDLVPPGTALDQFLLAHCRVLSVGPNDFQYAPR